MQKNLVFIALFFLGQALQAQTIPELYSKSLKAHNHKQYEVFLKTTQELDSMRPGHPTYIYNLACAYALTGKFPQAFETLEKSIMMDNKTEFENEPDFDSIKGLPDFQKMIQLKAEQGKSVISSQKEVTLDEKDLHPEGLIYLKKSKKWLVASVHKGKIVSFDIKNGKCTDWLKAEGVFSVMSMKADADEKYLWVATAAMPELSGYDQTMTGKAEVLKVNIKSKTIEQRFSLPGKHVFGDLVVARNGIVYVSDSYDPNILKIENGIMAKWFVLGDHIYNFQGLTMNPDETKMYLADYFSGIVEIPIATPEKKHWLTFPKGTVVKGIDGLAWYGNSLIAIHNGVNPIRIMQYFLDAAGENITGFKVIDNNRPEFNEPAMGIAKDGRFYFFANNPWQAYDKKHDLDESKVENPMLYSFKLD